MTKFLSKYTWLRGKSLLVKIIPFFFAHWGVLQGKFASFARRRLPVLSREIGVQSLAARCGAQAGVFLSGAAGYLTWFSLRRFVTSNRFKMSWSVCKRTSKY